MAVIYFTNNASTGAGSLVEAIKNASPGDVIRPDETVFERGSTIEIILASTLNVDKSLTFDGGPYRVRLNGDGLSRCCNVASGVNVEITAFDIVGGGWNSQTGLDQGSANGAGVSVAGDSSIVLKRCGFFGCRGSFGGGLSIAANSTAELSDCVIVGCYARGSGAGLRSQGLTKVYSSTIIGNVGAGSTTAHDVLVDGSGCATFVNSIVRKCSGNVEIGAGCVVGVAPSQIGFVAPPPDDLSAETWNADAWRNWDLRLLDDASPNPSPYRDSGDVDAASKYDFDGNFRGRETNGAATRSPGAYETIQADLFWSGDGWSASRFASAPGDAAPQAGQTLFADGAVDFDDAAPQNATLIVGGRGVVSVGDGSALGLSLGIGAALSLSVSAATLRRFAPFAKLDWVSGDLAVGGDVSAETLSIPPGSALNIDGGFVRVGALVVADGARVAFSSERGDAILTATESATVGAASFFGTGYFATPQGAELTAATFAETVRACAYGAGVAAFAATATGPKTARLEWSATDATQTACVECETATGWNVINARASSATDGAITTPGVTRFRLFDGEKFLYDVAWYLTGDQFTAAGFCYATTTNETSSVEYATRGRIVTTSSNGLIYYGQSVAFIQRIANAFTGELLKNDGGNVTAVKYSLYKRETGLFSNTADATAIFEKRDAPTTCVLEVPQTSEVWNEDGAPVEYNFVLTPPNSITEPFLPSPGEYFLRVAVELSTGNPIISIFEFSVL